MTELNKYYFVKHIGIFHNEMLLGELQLFFYAENVSFLWKKIPVLGRKSAEKKFTNLSIITFINLYFSPIFCI